MAEEQQASLKEVLDFQPPDSSKIAITLSHHPGYGESTSGGYIHAALQKVAVLYATNQPALKNQLDVLVSTSTFLRPIFPGKGPLSVEIQEISIGKTSSLLHLKAFQGHSAKPAALLECILTSFSIRGITLDTNWRPQPAPTPVDLIALEQDAPRDNPAWACYHTPFYANGFRRAHSYIKYFLPVRWTAGQSHGEQWVLPGWDCHPLGSRDPSLPEARWTTEMIPFVLDVAMPVQENYFINPGRPLPIASVPCTLGFAETQRKARQDDKRDDWRELPAGPDGDGSRPDGLKAFLARDTHGNATLRMTIEIKRNLPPAGVRWLYLRSEVKSIQESKMDLQVLCFDENMDLIAIRNGTEHLRPSSARLERPQREKRRKADERL